LFKNQSCAAFFRAFPEQWEKNELEPDIFFEAVFLCFFPFFRSAGLKKTEMMLK